MRLLLDTHTWIWTQERSEELGPKTRDMLLDSGNKVAVSPISTLEIARMVTAGRIILAKELRQWVRAALVSLEAESLPVNHEIALESYRLPEPFHRDPADRMLVATARIEGCTLLTADTLLLEYPHVRTADARD